jgi:hypothetical protein
MYNRLIDWALKHKEEIGEDYFWELCNNLTQPRSVQFYFTCLIKSLSFLNSKEL